MTSRQHHPLSGLRAALFPFISLVLISIVVISDALRLSAKLIYLSWPGKQVIPSILYERGELNSDFLSSSSVNSPYHLSAKFFATILPNQWDELLATFGTVSFLLKILILWLSVILLVRTWCVLVEKVKLIESKYIYAYSSTAYVIFSLLLPVIYFRGQSAGLGGLFHGAQVGGWDYPLHDSLNPSGLSFAALLIALSLGLSEQKKLSSLRSVSLFALLTLSSLIHPIVPLISVPYYLFMSIASKSSLSLDVFFLKRALLCFLGCTCGAATLLYLYPQGSINSLDYYQIYVVERHPHHYLPSSYTANIKLNLFVNITLSGALAFATFHARSSWWSIKVFLACFFYLFAIHTIQYIFVELLKIPLFITLGASRLSGLYNFMYLLLLALFSSSLLTSYQWEKKSLKHYELIIRYLKRPSTRSIVSAAPIIFFAVTAISMWRIQSNQIALFESQPERAIRKAFDSQTSNQAYQVLSEVHLYNLREVGGIPVFSDNYFPFSKEAILSWDERRVLSKGFFDCLKETRSPKSCSDALSRYKNLFLLSLDSDLHGDISFEVETSAGHIYAYKLL